MKNFTKNIVLWIIVGLLLVALFNLFQGGTSNKSITEISFSDFIIATDSGNVSEVNIRGNNNGRNIRSSYTYFRRKTKSY